MNNRLVSPIHGLMTMSLGRNIAKAAKVKRMMPNDAATTWFMEAVPNSEFRFGTNASKMANMPRLNAQLPKISPTARSADCRNADELMPTINSGRDVTDAIRISPTHAFPMPVFSASRSP